MPHGSHSFYLASAQMLSPMGGTEIELSRLGVRFLNIGEARAVAFSPLFQIYEEEDYSIALPSRSHTNIILPGNMTEHEAINVEGLSLRASVEQRANILLSEEKYLFLAKRAWVLAVRLNRFSYHALRLLRIGYSTSSFILFDSCGEVQIAFNDDLEVTLISRRGDPSNELSLNGKGPEFWNAFFNQHFTKFIAPHQTHLDFINEHFVPNLPGIEMQKFPPGTKVIDLSPKPQ